jgi:hypothetical protein
LTWGQIQAQYLGHNFKGDFGLMSGSQPAPGFYFAPVYARYSVDTLRDRLGNAIEPDVPGSLDTNAYVFGAWYVSNFKIAGANYGFMFFPSFTNNKFEVPILEIDDRVDTGLTDLYFSPLNLGWNASRADFTAGLGVYAPTGRYDPEASDNRGLGMWTFEPYFGTTVYLDEAKSWHLATTANYEMHTEKKDTEIQVGDILTLEGGLGKSFMQGLLTMGAAYFAQWKVTSDDFGSDMAFPEGQEPGKHRVFGLGPEVTLPIATSSRLIATLNLRYFWDMGARTTLEGETFLLTVTFPIPSVKLN